MAVKVDRIQDQILNEIAFREDWKPLYKALKHLFDITRQNRTRTGGDSDAIENLDTQENETLLAAAESRIAALEQRLESVERDAMLRPVLSTEHTDRDMHPSLVYSLIERIEALEAQI